ncbi:hypothetical protein F5Y18DRAFT_421634 [Xylariaceae sp. FL1019]|nr:hypothetical protein F5Y18DRAFT_421634 [Xylariaceae sp. FL1019]
MAEGSADFDLVGATERDLKEALERDIVDTLQHLRLRSLPVPEPVTANRLLAKRNEFLCRDKRQQNGWVVFYWEIVLFAATENPDLTYKEIEQILFDIWRSRSAEVQSEFCDRVAQGPELDSDNGRSIRWGRAIVQMAKVFQLILQPVRIPTLEKLIGSHDFEGLCEYFDVTQTPSNVYREAHMRLGQALQQQIDELNEMGENLGRLYIRLTIIKASHEKLPQEGLMRLSPMIQKTIDRLEELGANWERHSSRLNTIKASHYKVQVGLFQQRHLRHVARAEARLHFERLGNLINSPDATISMTEINDLGSTRPATSPT